MGTPGSSAPSQTASQTCWSLSIDPHDMLLPSQPARPYKDPRRSTNRALRDPNGAEKWLSFPKLHRQQNLAVENIQTTRTKVTLCWIFKRLQKMLICAATLFLILQHPFWTRRTCCHTTGKTGHIRDRRQISTQEIMHLGSICKCTVAYILRIYIYYV